MKKERKYTPENIEVLGENEVFVFGSNLNGNHFGGAARIAYERFGAVWGRGEGLMGRSYALPTLDEKMRRVSEDDLKRYLERFIGCVFANPNLRFYLTKVGCGIAGWKVEDVKKMFWEVIESYAPKGTWGYVPINLIIPIDFERKEMWA